MHQINAPARQSVSEKSWEKKKGFRDNSYPLHIDYLTDTLMEKGAIQVKRLTSKLATWFGRIAKRIRTRGSATSQGRFISEEANYEDHLAQQLECVKFTSVTVGTSTRSAIAC